MLARLFSSPPYRPVPQTSGDRTFEKIEDPRNYTDLQKLLKAVYLLVACLLFGIIGFALGVEVVRNQYSTPIFADTVPQVFVGWSQETFRYNETFANLNPEADGSEPAWDTLIPNGLGYVRDAKLAPNLSVVSAFHQLHCLYTIRRAYYSTSKPGEQEGFDFGLDRRRHTSHCFEYLRQSLMCSADSSIEPTDSRNEEGFLGWDFHRQCRSYVELKAWAENSRAFEAHGFLAADLVQEHQSHHV